MNARLAVVFLFLSVPASAFADTLVMKSGQEKTGKILEETDKQYLFKSEADGAVLEIPKISVAIVDLDVDAAAAPKGSLQVFSVSHQKKKKDASAPPKKSLLQSIAETGEAPPAEEETVVDKGSDEPAALSSFEKMIGDWISHHPEAEKYIKEWMEKFNGKSDELDKVMKTAKES